MYKLYFEIFLKLGVRLINNIMCREKVEEFFDRIFILNDIVGY